MNLIWVCPPPGDEHVLLAQSVSKHVTLGELRFWSTQAASIWQIAEATWVATLGAEVLQERVDVKALRLPEYRTRGLDAYWLLVCAHPTNHASRFDLGLDFVGTSITSPFDRTIYFYGWHRLELGTPAS